MIEKILGLDEIIKEYFLIYMDTIVKISYFIEINDLPEYNI